MNTVCFLGYICNDVELKVTPTGKNVCSFTLAVHRPYTKDTTDFFDVVCWDKQAESLCQHCKKGTQIGVTGMLTSRKYQDKDGNNSTKIEISANSVDFVGGKKASTEQTGGAYTQNEVEFEEMSNDETLPF